jgi:hypothetical protein
MAKSTPAEIIVEFDDGAAAAQNISQYSITLNGISVEQILERADSFGDSWEEHLPIGKGKVAPVVIGGHFDDTASTGPDALFKITTPDGPATASRTLKVTWRTGKTTSVETFRQKYDRNPVRDGLTKFEATLQPTGATVEV